MRKLQIGQVTPIYENTEGLVSLRKFFNSLDLIFLAKINRYFHVPENKMNAKKSESRQFLLDLKPYLT